MNRRQQAVIEYLQEEVRVLQAQLGKRPRFTESLKDRPRILTEKSMALPPGLLASHRLKIS